MSPVVHTEDRDTNSISREDMTAEEQLIPARQPTRPRAPCLPSHLAHLLSHPYQPFLQTQVPSSPPLSGIFEFSSQGEGPLWLHCQG